VKLLDFDTTLLLVTTLHSHSATAHQARHARSATRFQPIWRATPCERHSPTRELSQQRAPRLIWHLARDLDGHATPCWQRQRELLQQRAPRSLWHLDSSATPCWPFLKAGGQNTSHGSL
jgi:hypothetical protein